MSCMYGIAMNQLYQFTLDGAGHFYATEKDGYEIAEEINNRRENMSLKPHKVVKTPITIQTKETFFDHET